MNRQPHVDEILRRGVLVAGLLCASFLAAAPSSEATLRAEPAAIVGTFTGELTQAGPVYRLPQVQVIAYRKAELARAERDERLRQTAGKATRPEV